MGSYGGSVLDPILKGIQLRQMLDDIKFRKELRERQKQEFDLDLQARKRQQAMQDFQTAITLEKIGAIPAMPGDTGQNDAAIAQAVNITPENRRRMMPSPIGNYRLPSEMDVRNKALRLGDTEAEIEYAKEYAGAKGKAAGTVAEGTIPVTYPAIGDQPSVTVQVPRSQYPTAIKTLRELQSDSFGAHSFQKDDDGNVTFVGIPKGGGEPKKVALGPIGTKGGAEKGMSDPEKRARAQIKAKARASRDYTPEAYEKEVQAYADGRYQTLAQAAGIDWQYEQDAAGKGQYGFVDTEKAKNVAQVKAEARKWAEEVVNKKKQQLEEAYTEEELGSVSSTSTASPAAKSTKTAGRVPVLKAANIAEAARRKGMTPEQFRSWFTQQGGVIQ
jgi:hypothetical protein